MITKQKETWYVARRGELLAEQFLIELKPDYVTPMRGGADLGFDYVAFFTKPDKSPIAIAVVVKITESPINGRYPFPVSQLRQLRGGTLPVLVLVIDVKHNEMYFNWADQAVSPDQADALNKRVSCTATLRPSTPEEQEKLRHEILEQKAWMPFS